MLNIAPLDYERYAVLVNPLLIPGPVNVAVKPPQRRTEPVNPASADLGNLGSSAGNAVKSLSAVPARTRTATPDRDLLYALNRPHPISLNRLAQVPSKIWEAEQFQPGTVPRRVAELYESPGEAPRETIRLSA